MPATDGMVIGREPGPGLRMFSAKFFSLSFPVNLYCGPSQVCNDHSQLGAFRPQGAKTPLFGPTIRYIHILCHCDVKNRHRNTIFGRKHLHIVGKATRYDLGALLKTIPQFEPFRLKNDEKSSSA